MYRLVDSTLEIYHRDAGQLNIINILSYYTRPLERGVQVFYSCNWLNCPLFPSPRSFPWCSMVQLVHVKLLIVTVIIMSRVKFKEYSTHVHQLPLGSGREMSERDKNMTTVLSISYASYAILKLVSRHGNCSCQNLS